MVLNIYFVGMLDPKNLTFVLAGSFVRSIGTLPVGYVFSSMLADVLDHIEWKNGFRVDGASGGVYSVLITAGSGIGLGILNTMLAVAGYQSPSSLLQANGTYGAQSASIQTALGWCYFGVGIVANLIMAFIVYFIRAEEEMPRITSELMERKKLEAESRGEVWVDPVELAQKETQESILAKENTRIEKLKMCCEIKGLDFDTEEAKYQVKLEKKAKKKK